jgi:adenine deaminase
LSPLVKLQAVLTRPDGRSFDKLEDVIPMLTINAATLLGLDTMTGSLEIGKSADLVVLNQNIFDLDFYDIAASTCVEITMLQGQVVYQSDGTCSPEPSSSITSNGSASAVSFLWNRANTCYIVPMVIAYTMGAAYTLASLM